MWPFLTRFGRPADPVGPIAHTRVFETYPVLAMIALGWMLPDSRAAGRLPKYNPKPAQNTSPSKSDQDGLDGLPMSAGGLLLGRAEGLPDGW